MYQALLALHGDLRWLVLIAGAVSIIAAIRGLSGKVSFRPLGRVTSLVFTTSMDLQLVLGIALCFVSPWVAQFWASPGASMKIKEARFFGMEHGLLMLVAVALAHIGAARCKRIALQSASDAKAYRIMLVWNSLAFIVILAGIPWWRPLFQC